MNRPAGPVATLAKRSGTSYIVDNRSSTNRGARILPRTRSLARTVTQPAIAPAVPAGGAGATTYVAPRLARRTFREHIADRLRAAILAGEIAPGAALTEMALATQFDVSRGPLREALRQLVEEGLLVTVSYTGTRVVTLSVEDIQEIHSMRIALERFAFEQTWDRRDATFRDELKRRHATLTRSIDLGNDAASIEAELALHALVYEASGHRLLQRTWAGLRGRLQLYWAAHHRAHGSRGPRRDSHDSYVRRALGSDLDAMRAEIDVHMRRGLDTTERFLRDGGPAEAATGD